MLLSGFGVVGQRDRERRMPVRSAPTLIDGVDDLMAKRMHFNAAAVFIRAVVGLSRVNCSIRAALAP